MGCDIIKQKSKGERKWGMIIERKININFFIKDGVFDKRAISKGVYSIRLRNRDNDKEIKLYVGQSVWMIVRCAGHLHRIFTEPEYMGLKVDDLDRENFELVFKVEGVAEKREELSSKERDYIEKLKPLTQGKIRDWQVDNKFEIVQDAIKRDLI